MASENTPGATVGAPCRITALSEWIRVMRCETHEVEWRRADSRICPYVGFEAA